jgi:hypothetical protein
MRLNGANRERDGGRIARPEERDRRRPDINLRFGLIRGVSDPNISSESCGPVLCFIVAAVRCTNLCERK